MLEPDALHRDSSGGRDERSDLRGRSESACVTNLVLHGWRPLRPSWPLAAFSPSWGSHQPRKASNKAQAIQLDAALARASGCSKREPHAVVIHELDLILCKWWASQISNELLASLAILGLNSPSHVNIEPARSTISLHVAQPA